MGGKLADSKQTLIIILMCQCIAFRPFDKGSMGAALSRMRDEVGISTLVECAGHLAGAEAVTKSSDLGCVAPVPKFVNTILQRFVVPMAERFSQ